MIKTLALAVMLLGCRAMGPVPPPVPPPDPGPFPALRAQVAPVGLVGDGVADDRLSMQAALDAGIDGAGTIVVVPVGTYRITKGASFYGLRIPALTTLRCAPGAVFVLDAVAGQATKLIEIEAGGVTVEGCDLRGHRELGIPDEHMHGINATGAPFLRLTNVHASNFAGDGFYIYNGCDDLTITGVSSIGNDRNGITLGGTMSRVLVTGSVFAGSKAQQFDSEAPTGAQYNVTVEKSTFDTAGATQQYVMTISGSSTAMRSKQWLIEHNRINGAVIVTWGEAIRIQHNRGVNPTQFGWRVYRGSYDVTIEDNDVTSTQTTVPTYGVVSVAGTANNIPGRIHIIGNHLVAIGNVQTQGVRVEGADSVEIAGNNMEGPGFASNGGAGVYLRATNPAVDFVSAVVKDNRISNWGSAGVIVQGNGAAVMRYLNITGNTFDDTAGSMTAAMALNDGTDCARTVEQAGNVTLGGVTMLVRTSPAGVRAAWGSGDRWTR
jgi:hypothetical protein